MPSNARIRACRLIHSRRRSCVKIAPDAHPFALLAAAATLALGLWADMHVDLPGQLLISAAVWALFLALIAPLPASERRLYLACVAIATAGELFLSLVWGLYTYRLGNVPLFVPPGHALMLMLGFWLTRRMPEAAARTLLGGAGAYTLLKVFGAEKQLAAPRFVEELLALLTQLRQRGEDLYRGIARLSAAQGTGAELASNEEALRAARESVQG